MLDAVTTAWESWWWLCLALNAIVLWLFCMALVFGSSAGPLSSGGDLTSLERLAQHGASIRGSEFDPRRRAVSVGTETAALIERFEPRTKQLWRVNRGVFLPARFLALSAFLVGAAQLLFTLLAFVPRFPSTSWVFISMSVLAVDLICGIAVLMAERRRWRRRAPFELLLTRAVLQAVQMTEGALTWTVARHRLATIEQVLNGRFERVKDRPLTATDRDSDWQRRVRPWAQGLARIDVQLEASDGRPAALLSEQVESVVRAIQRPARRNRDGLAAAPSPAGPRLDPQARVGWTVLLFVCVVAIFFAGVGTLDLMLTDRNQLPSSEELGAALSFIGPMVTTLAAIFGGLAWVRRRLAAPR